jgi:hypothetical protein
MRHRPVLLADGATKPEFPARRWTYIQKYADAKTQVVDAILARSRPR